MRAKVEKWLTAVLAHITTLNGRIDAFDASTNPTEAREEQNDTNVAELQLLIDIEEALEAYLDELA